MIIFKALVFEPDFELEFIDEALSKPTRSTGATYLLTCEYMTLFWFCIELIMPEYFKSNGF